jgi:8-oxo-dGTP pyrophosphatase MutT (NUDIX family)|tara:strand:+ start:445 stop:1182 length:738 start_codon:yes stop_codon:yes gene_type:complete
VTEHIDNRRYEAWARHHAEHGATELIPAATVIVMRDGDGGLEVLMLRRNSKIAFGGMWVFPGGRIDDTDTITGTDGKPDELATAAAAAVREASEEADLTVDAGSLVWFSYWVPPPITPKRFSTFFFATRVASGEVSIDDGEITEHAWLSPAAAMKLRDLGEIELAPPTWMTLDLLTAWNSTTEALEALDEMAPLFYETHMARTDDGVVAMWSGDAGYEAEDPSVPGARHRLTMNAGSYRLERSPG